MARNRDEISLAIIAAAPHARRFAYSLCRNAAEADDLVQSAIERVLSRGVPDGTDMKRWMFKICRNLWIDGLRAKSVRTDAAPEIGLAAPEPVSAETEAADRIMLQRTEAAIDALPPAYREVLALVAVGGSSYKEASETLEVPVGTVMSRLARARAMLADATGYAA
ncbi:RNA polymerase sigma factor [Hyphomonas sp.]|uniref:RNA polymerase sigma factor n=1 Tax=Hyphomonas sp. TaxID=87 RepID=UPI0039188D2F